MSTQITINFKEFLQNLFQQALAQVAPEQTDIDIAIERSRQAQHGDYACNLAMQLARPLRQAPRQIAQQLLDALPPCDYIKKTEIAGAGFINIFLTAAARQQIVQAVLQQGDQYGRIQLGQQQRVQVEFVSANPTGPLHVGHGRGAAYGASLSNVLDAAGYQVTREYYVNDAGRQMDILAVSTWLRYLNLHQAGLTFPAGAYQGDYVIEMATALQQKYQDALVIDSTQVMADIEPDTDPVDQVLDQLIQRAKTQLGAHYQTLHQHVLQAQVNDIRDDLQQFGVEMDVWFSEQSLFDDQKIDRAIEQLKNQGHLYQQEGTWWFRSTDFGDSKDRVVQRENGQYTYFASDIAYHLHKYERGFDRIINIWGADHHGYIPRVKGAMQALNQNAEQLTVALVQFAVLYRHGEKISMSTRSGEFVTLRELRDEVGCDATRFFYVMRKSDQHLDFDLDLAKSNSNENPVYYIQYAHARIQTVLKQWQGESQQLKNTDLSLLDNPAEQLLLQQLMDYPQTIEAAARDLAPHHVAFYLKDLAAHFHSYYNSSRFLVEDEALKLARLSLITAVAQVMQNGLKLLGVSAPESM